MTVVIDGRGLGPEAVVAIARAGETVSISDNARAAMAASRAVVDRADAASEPVYGVSTGFGSLATVFIPADQRARLQLSLVRSHAAGVGPAVESDVVRA